MYAGPGGGPASGTYAIDVFRPKPADASPESQVAAVFRPKPACASLWRQMVDVFQPKPACGLAQPLA
jgi:hypothetical protein